MKDRLSWKDTYSCQVLYLNVIEPATKDHLSSETTFVWPFKTGSTVLDVTLQILCLSLCTKYTTVVPAI